MVSTTTASRTRPSVPGSYAEEIESGIAQLTAVLTGPLGAEMPLAATGSATAARRLTFRSRRGRSSGQPGTNDC
jgi:hypothetical protein